MKYEASKELIAMFQKDLEQTDNSTPPTREDLEFIIDLLTFLDGYPVQTVASGLATTLTTIANFDPAIFLTTVVMLHQQAEEVINELKSEYQEQEKVAVNEH